MKTHQTLTEISETLEDRTIEEHQNGRVISSRQRGSLQVAFQMLEYSNKRKTRRRGMGLLNPGRIEA